jgi:hypothetical protein
MMSDPLRGGGRERMSLLRRNEGVEVILVQIESGIAGFCCADYLSEQKREQGGIRVYIRSF